MGILDEQSSTEVKRRRDALKANIAQLANDEDVSYKEAVNLFAQRIGRSPVTVYGWLSSPAKRPMPAKHFHKLVDKGMLDPKLKISPAVRH